MNEKGQPILTIDRESVTFQTHCPICGNLCGSKNFSIRTYHEQSFVEASFLCESCHTGFEVKTSELHTRWNNGKA